MSWDMQLAHWVLDHVVFLWVALSLANLAFSRMEREEAA